MDRVSEGKGRCRCSCYLLWGQTNGSTFPFMKMRGPGASFLFMYENVNNCAAQDFQKPPLLTFFCHSVPSSGTTFLKECYMGSLSHDKSPYEIREKADQSLGTGQPPCHAGNKFLSKLKSEMLPLGLKKIGIERLLQRHVDQSPQIYIVTKSTSFLN